MFKLKSYKPVTRESVVQKAIIRILQTKKFLVIRFNSGGMPSEKNGKRYFTKFYTICNTGKSSGLSDLIAFNKTDYYFIEVKAKNGKLSDSQKEFKALLEYMEIDFRYFVFDNWEDCLKWVETL